ncbi:MAG: MBL fold metallo-hydrolase [Nitrososphaerota archaeon]|jgi:ribonuclease Z|nr:MBL fold metallo-hydrolase [Nitrososphaerota archaeon]MDG6927426.1 MBL fold metallo-hydrolase [Nitrososphaerota archaeon]MDG6931230.1 MBL fold metallo-hydrolase [Nitrososphaerota archaeon]MDG6931893.1 MBL fold metallo-hydrolase [Nitrososphaerota archaeon]MDG6936587.1 MBL fold metallo-hydrolase [Nitrososphaerota archaeon]
MKLTVLGSGGSAQTVRRACASYLLGDKILIDAGPGSYRNLLKAGGDPLQIKVLLLSHLHGDHFFDIGSLTWGMSFMQRTDPLTIVGPAGTSAMVKSMLSIANTPNSFMKFRLEFIEIRPNDRFTIDGMTMLTAPGKHVIEDVAYRIGDICYTGDTAPSDSIVNLAAGSKLLIHEASGLAENEGMLKEVGHSSSRQAAQTASRAKVEKLLLSHITPAVSNKENDLLNQAKSEFSNVEIAEDLLTI